MQLLDDTLWNLYQAGKIGAEEAIDKSKIPGQMMDKFTRAGIDPGKNPDEFPDADEGGAAPAAGGGAPPAKPGGSGGGPSDAEKRAQIEANRARMAAMAAKK
jgi:hypothetical protein